MIDNNQNISLDKSEDWFLPILIQTADGVTIDISQDNIELFVTGGFSLVAGAHPINAKGRQFHFTAAMAQSLTRASDYEIIRTFASIPQVLLSGRIAQGKNLIAARTVAGDIIFTLPDSTTMVIQSGLSGPQGIQGIQGNAATLSIGNITTGAAGSSATAHNSGTNTAAILDLVIPQGIQGAKGDAATISLGTVTTGSAGSSASATNAGTTSNAVLNLTIPRGDTGATGATGNAATVAIGTVSTLSAGSPATVTNSGTSGAAVLNIGIPQGVQGLTGATGTAATLAIGTVTTGAAGTTATANNSGSSSAAILNLQIPRGDTGATGATGSVGATGSAATISLGTVASGAAGTAVTITNSGTSGAAIFNFTIPKGDLGATGATGTAATIGVGTVSTGAAGSSATVTNVGTTSAASLNFTIPQGVQGATGSAATISLGTVTTGAAGSSATITNSGTSGAAILNFTIPKGDLGATGSTGSQGPAATVSIGSVTTLAAGASATVTNSGTSGAAVLNFAIPQGAMGTAAGALAVANNLSDLNNVTNARTNLGLGNSASLNTATAGDNLSTTVATSAFVQSALGSVAISTTGGSTTLTTAQAAASTLVVSGALTSNAVLIFGSGSVGAFNREYVIVNNTTGAFTLTLQACVTSPSATVVSGQGKTTPILINGNAVLVADTDYAASPVDLSGAGATGVLAAGRHPALTGDITSAAGALATTLATVNGNVGSFGSGSAVPILTVNAKGLVTAVSTVALGTAATYAVGTSGATIPLLNTVNAWSGAQTFGNTVTISGGLLSVTSGSNVFKFNNGASNTTPNIALGTNGGKSLALLAGTNGTAFVFDNTGTFAIACDTKANIDGGSTAGNSSLMTVNSSGVTMNGTTTMAGNTYAADLYASRSTTSGVVFLGTNGSHYLYFDGTNYNMPSGSLVLGGGLTSTTFTTSGNATVGGGLSANGITITASTTTAADVNLTYRASNYYVFTSYQIGYGSQTYQNVYSTQAGSFGMISSGAGHSFRSLDGSATFLNITSGGLTSSTALILSGNQTVPAASSTSASIFRYNGGGLAFQGQGSTYDFIFLNRSQLSALALNAGTSDWMMGGALTTVGAVSVGSTLTVAGTSSHTGVSTFASKINAANLPVYATEAAAVTGGLTTGDLYKTSTGELRVKL